MTPTTHNLKAAGSNPAPATNFEVLGSESLKNLKANESALAALAKVICELGQRLQEIGAVLHPDSLSLNRPEGPRLCDLLNEFLVCKVQSGSRERYLTELRHALNAFGEGRLARGIVSITTGEIEDWLCRENWAAATRKSYLTDLCTFFNWAVKRGHLAKSPAAAIDKPLLEDKAPFVHSPEEVRAVLNASRQLDADLCRLLAIQYFAGLRPSEAAKLEERHLLPGLIEVEGPRCKSRKRRLVTVEPVLSAWLGAGGRLPVKNLKRRWLRVREAAGVSWGHDVTRHSFCTYHLAAFENAAKAALCAGHSEAVLFGKYRAIRLPDGRHVTKELARGFWGLEPGRPSG